VKFFTDLGVDVNTIINTIHEFLGLPPYQPKHSTRRGVGFSGLIEDIIAILPVDELKALFDEKIQTSPEFQALIAGIQSPEFAVSIRCVYLSYVSCCLGYVHTSV
jgi:hypothetical protein